MKKKNGITMLVLILIAIFAILVVACIIKAVTNNNDKDNNDYDYDVNDDGYYLEDEEFLEEENKYKKISKKDISVITIDGVDYDLTKTPRELGISISRLNEVKEIDVKDYQTIKDQINNDEISGLVRDTQEYIDLLGYETIDIVEEKAIENIIVEPNTVIDCNFNLSFGYGAIKNNSNTPKNIYDCDIVYYHNVYVTEGTSLGNIHVGVTTEEEIKKIYGTSYIDGEDGSELKFYFNDGVLSNIHIYFEKIK
ncbi:MAG: hypothetical protein E7311_03795 [Clostridiales bacterium]|nr:hypothetical protein [Clostridiales bacterium]